MKLNGHPHAAHIPTLTPAAGDTGIQRGGCGFLKPDPHPQLCKASLVPTSGGRHQRPTGLSSNARCPGTSPRLGRMLGTA